MAIIQKIKRRVSPVLSRIEDAVEHHRDNNRYVKADFDEGGASLHKYLKLHRNRYHRSAGAHFLIQLYEAGPDVFDGFVRKHSRHGWHFTLTHEESRALKRARDLTCSRSRIANLRYTTNIFEMLTNGKQLIRMLGLGAAAGSAGILLGLGEIFFFAKETVKEFLASTLGISFASPAEQNARYVDLAQAITQDALGQDGSLDQGIVAARIADLVTALEDGGTAEAAIRQMSYDSTYIVGVLSGIVFLIVGRGLIRLIMEGMGGTISKIEALVEDMDAYVNWKLGRSPFPASSEGTSRSLIMPQDHNTIHTCPGPHLRDASGLRP